ncbi:hypothetical protein [Volucribacter amazonae]|uniref:Uncharacterized protein n=1 Tax=Volucribacter amazonae TaxID=256731 RepID=A0A9X4PB51_9PAST|nr:hypothetical protein [Volucribacter amazonae]MDG6894316.1 hypothetical protein [Volucribacter amazonae]
MKITQFFNTYFGNKIKIILFLLLVLLCYKCNFSTNVYLVSLGETIAYPSIDAVLERDKNSEITYLNKGEYVKVNKLVDVKTYFIYQVDINGSKKYIISGDYVVINKDKLWL